MSSLPTIINCLLSLGGNILLHSVTVGLPQWNASPMSRIWEMAQWKELKMIRDKQGKEKPEVKETCVRCREKWFMSHADLKKFQVHMYIHACSLHVLCVFKYCPPPLFHAHAVMCAKTLRKDWSVCSSGNSLLLFYFILVFMCVSVCVSALGW